MENTIIKEITTKGLETYFKSRQYEAMYWPTLFPLKNVTRLDFTTLIGEQGSRVAADVIAFDASAPLKTRRVVSKMTGDIPKIALKRKMTEKDMLEYMMLSDMASADEKIMLDLIWEDVDFVVQGINARIEWLALQAASKTKITLATSNNNGIVTEEAVDFLMPTANKKGAAVVWSAIASTTTPITDFKAVVKAARTAGVTLRYAFMHPDQYDYFIASTETINYLKAYYKLETSDTLPFDNREKINAALNSAGLPQIIVVDQSVGIESKAGVITNVNPWDSNYVLFTPATGLGRMLNGPIAEEKMPPKQVTQSKAGNVLVSKFSTVDPLSEFTKGEANSFPSWSTVDQCYSLKTSGTSWS
jgi:hypothetical protein